MKIFNLFVQRFVRLIRNALHQELLYQLEGLINIEIGTYIYKLEECNNIKHYTGNNLEILFDKGGDGLDIYVLPKTEELTFDTMDKYMIGHYHSDDLLYLMVNWEKKRDYLITNTTRIFSDYYFRQNS